MRLIDVERGVWFKVVGFEGDGNFQQHLLRHGLYPGDYARVLRTAPLSGPLLVEVGGREVALGPGVAEKIIIEVQ